MADAIGPNLNVSRRRKISTTAKTQESFLDLGSTVEDEYDEDFVAPSKRGRFPKHKPPQIVNSYDSIQLEVTKEKQRKTPARKPKASRSVKREKVEEVEDPELTMSSRMVDRIAALNHGKRTKVVMANCFEDRTALDCIDDCLKESENMQEDAVTLAIATGIYSLRVDRTHNDAQETRYTFIRGKSDAEKAMLLAAGEDIENTRDKRKRKKAEKDAEVKRKMDAEDEDYRIDDNEQQEWIKASDAGSIDYTFGLKFPNGGTFLQHWSYAQEILERVENRHVDVRKGRRRRKLMSWKKIPPLEFCSTHTDFVHVTSHLESDRIDALATFQARRDVTGKMIVLHDAMVRRPVPPSRYCEEVEVQIVKQCQAMLANPLHDEPTTWEHYLLEDNPRLYRTGQYLKTGDMTGYVLQERPFYHHFDPDMESADDLREESCVEKNADRTLYTFKKPARGKAFSRTAPLIRVPVNKYANPRNRKIEDVYFKETIEVKPDVDNINGVELEKVVKDSFKQLQDQSITTEDLLGLGNHLRTKQEDEQPSEVSDEEEDFDTVTGGTLLSRLTAKHKEHLGVLDKLRKDVIQRAREKCTSVVKECREIEAKLASAADQDQADEEDLKELKSKLFLDGIVPLKEETFAQSLHDVFSNSFRETSLECSNSYKRGQPVAVLGAGRDAVEWQVTDEAIFSDILNFIKRGIHSDLRYMDATYHMKVFKFRITVEQAHESLRRADRMGAGMAPEQLALLKQKCFRPGRYNGIRDSGEVSKFYRIDPWSLHSSTLEFSKQYFRCCCYPRLEGGLLQLQHDIQEASRKITADSLYFKTVSDEEVEVDRANWQQRLSEAITAFTSSMSKPEEKSFRDRRSLPKISRRSLAIQKCRLSNGDAAVLTNSSVAFHTDPGACDINYERVDEPDMDDFGGAGDFAFPSDDAYAHVEEEVRSIAERPADDVFASSTDPNATPSVDAASRKGKNKLDITEGPPKKKERRIKTEADIKVEPVDTEYFVKSETHTPFVLKNRFAIGNARTTTRGEADTFARKPVPRKSLSDYKVENFVKPGLIHKGPYPGVKLEVSESTNGTEAKFTGVLKRTVPAEEPRQPTPQPDVDGAVSDEWLTTFGGFRALPEEAGGQLEVAKPVEQPTAPPSVPQEHDTFAASENDVCADDSFNDSVYLPDTSKRDRFNDIRPDEFKAIGIDLKNIVPKKDFNVMSAGERAAKVDAEFEEAYALGPKKEDGYVISIMDFTCRLQHYNINTAKMKRVMKSILSNPLLAYDKVLYARRALLARHKLDESHSSQAIGPEVYFKKLDRSLDPSLGKVAEKILEEHNPMDITAIDPIDVLEAVNYRNLDDIVDEGPSNKQFDSTNAGVEESMRQFAAEVRQADFKVQGLHTFSSVMQCLPRRMGSMGKHVNIANALAVTLYMCNENSLTLVQERIESADRNAAVNDGEPWMGNFIICNADEASSVTGQPNGADVFGDGADS